MAKLTERQLKLLRIIVDEYTYSGEPVGSKLVSTKYKLGVSPQTIRNEMAYLEKIGFLEKTHTSSGRIPSTSGLEYYDQNMALPKIDNIIEERLKSIFIKREDDIDSVINDALTMLSDITSLPSISSTVNLDETLREVTIVQLNDANAIMLVVTSLGNVYKNYIHITNQNQFDDVKVCVKLFNKYLIGTNLLDIDTKLEELEPIIKTQVHEYEYITQEIIKKLFNNTIKCARKPSVVGVTTLFQYPEFKDPEFLCKIMTMLETGNIWKQIQNDFDENDNVRIEFTDADTNKHNTIVVASTSIKLANNVERQISVVGPTRIKLSQVKGILNFLKNQIENMFNTNQECKENNSAK